MKLWAAGMLLLISGCAAPMAQPLMPFPDYRAFMVTKDLRYSIGSTGEEIVVPAGFVTDLASVPDILWSGISPLERHGTAAIIHDYLYWTQVCKDRLQADNLMYLAMHESGVGYLKREAMHLALRTFGGIAWNENAKDRARGLPRWVPLQMRSYPFKITWAELRKRLAAEGWSDPPITDIGSYCRFGNSTEIPDKFVRAAPDADLYVSSPLQPEPAVTVATPLSCRVETNRDQRLACYDRYYGFSD